MRKPLYNEPLTDEEQRFANENWGLIPFFLKRFNVGDDDLMYDCIISGYIHAIKSYFAEERLRQYKFGTIFEWKIRSLFEHLRQSRYRKSKYLQQIDFVYCDDNAASGGVGIGEKLNVCENIADEIDCFETVYYNDYFDRVTSLFTEKEKITLTYLLNGYSQSDTAKKMGCTRSNIQNRIKIMKSKITSSYDISEFLC